MNVFFTCNHSVDRHRFQRARADGDQVKPVYFTAFPEFVGRIQKRWLARVP